MPSAGGYEPPALSLVQLLENDDVLKDAMMAFMQSGNHDAFRGTVMKAAQAGDLGAELMLAEQYIPEQCTFEINQDVPRCGKNGNEAPKVMFRTNPLGIDASYEDASHWLERASAQGSGEASEVLAQLITRMHANGHQTNYTDADSAHLHALARQQGFDVEGISVSCYKVTPDGSGLRLGQMPAPIGGGPLEKPFSDDDLATLAKMGVTGTLRFGAENDGGDSVLLMRPEGPIAHVRVIVDHDPGHEVLLPQPARRDVIYVQRGDKFVAIPSEGSNLARSISLVPEGNPATQISIFRQTMDGGHSGASCSWLP